MVDKAAVPFWLCWSVALLIGLITGHLGLWLIIGAAAGVVFGLLGLAWAIRKKRRAF
jgi:hypothetical protein